MCIFNPQVHSVNLGKMIVEVETERSGPPAISEALRVDLKKQLQKAKENAQKLVQDVP